MELIENVGRREDVQGDMASFLDLGVRSLNGYERKKLFRNLGNGKFADVGYVAGADRKEDARGLAIFDADGDGKLDLLIQPFDAHPVLLMNRGKAGHWLEVRLGGTRCNKDAIGARVVVEAGGKKQMRELTTTAGYLSGLTKVLHFGLGEAEKIDRVTVTWPGPSRAVQTFEGIGRDQLVTLVEGEDAPMPSRPRKGQ
ncbi:CRTAC1 family protein [bacterium]|nr:CRTAC1 family protein [bacterium]